VAYQLFSQVPKEKALLWEISGNGLKKPSYLYGTIHLACPQDLKTSQTFTEKFNSTQQLYLEIDLDDSTKLMAASMKGMMMKDGNTMKKLLSEADYKKAATFFKEKAPSGYTLDMMGFVKPLMLSSMMLQGMVDCQMASWEGNLITLAKKQKMEVLGLEAIEDQFAVFDKIPYTQQAAMFMEYVNDFEKSKKQFTQMQELYRQQDIEGLYQTISTGSADYAKFQDVLLDNRNQNWIPVIEKAVEVKPTFFAVGAGHLGGKKGVINLLRKAGYKLKPIIQ
ncbi:MAG: TraB/GumN family protein, partial [Verrucomicrobia bacterium]|nr:TraB/GumN family protein [Cytophagales bacterium]